MANSKNNMDFHNAAGTYNYDTSARFGDYTNALNKDIIVNIINGANISVNNLNLNSSTLNVSSGNFEVRAATNLNEGTVNVGSGGTFVADSLTNLNSSTININGGTVELKGNLANNNGFTVDFKNNPNGSLLIDGPNEEDDAEAIVIKNYTYGNTIKINYDNDLKDGESLTTTYDKDSKTLTVQDSDGKQIIKFKNFTDVNGDNYPVVASAVTGANGDVYLVIACFLAGSMVRTPQGDVAVEEIQIGDEVIAFDWRNNTDSVRPVVWVGKAHVNVRHGLPDDEAGWPVRILKDAIADGVPYKDMLITAEHCLFFKDRFVPVRMLVNGVSIFYDKSITSYDYYHVETEQHSVITADGMLTESYLDTCNRSSFRQEGKVVTLFGATKSWEDDAGAPLGVERSFVEPLFRALEWREDKVSVKQAPADLELTSDPDLHLVTDTGAVVRPMRKTAHEYSFMLPPSTQSVRIVSRASRPSDVIGPFVDDRRYMGVAVGEVRLFCAKQQFDITSHLTAEKPAGWHADMGWDGVAWTSGNAELPLGEHLSNGKMGILSITVRAAGPYIKDSQAMTKSVKSA